MQSIECRLLATCCVMRQVQAALVLLLLQQGLSLWLQTLEYGLLQLLLQERELLLLPLLVLPLQGCAGEAELLHTAVKAVN